jgi:hypothetical protein
MSETIMAMAIDKVRLAALRMADTVSFHRLRDGNCYIDATKKCKPTASDPFAPNERRVAIPCEARLTDYRKEGMSGIPNDPSPTWVGFAWVSSAKYSPEWATVAHLLKAGDVLTLHWHASARDTQAIRDAGMACDYFTLEIKRGDVRLSFELDQYTGPAHRSTRMVKD